jgi:putative transcriptional regulator
MFDKMYSMQYISLMVRNRIKVLRAEQDLTQQQLAEAVGVIRQTIIAIEQGKYQPSVVLALRMAQFFHVKVEDIFTLSDTK